MNTDAAPGYCPQNAAFDFAPWLDWCRAFSSNALARVRVCTKARALGLG